MPQVLYNDLSAAQISLLYGVSKVGQVLSCLDLTRLIVIM